MPQEKTFDRADLLRFFYETDSDGLVGRLTVIHPLPLAQLAFDQDYAATETRRYPIVAATTALHCERYSLTVVIQHVVWPDGGDQYLPSEHELRTPAYRQRRVTTRLGGTSARLSRWVADLADAFRQEVADLIPAGAIDLARRQDDDGGQQITGEWRMVLSGGQTIPIPLAKDAEPEPEPADPPDAPAEQPEEDAGQPAAEPDPDHDASGETLDDLLSSLGDQEE